MDSSSFANVMLGIIHSLFQGVFDRLPDWHFDLPGPLQVLSQIGTLNDILPVYECCFCGATYAALVFGMIIFKWCVKVLDWIADILP